MLVWIIAYIAIAVAASVLFSYSVGYAEGADGVGDMLIPIFFMAMFWPIVLVTFAPALLGEKASKKEDKSN